ncbi:MAG: arylsulfatase [Verrucomicrobiales bacterium]|nr:arylsulfatase [Verrucomicrobiales bacterium]
MLTAMFPHRILTAVFLLVLACFARSAEKPNVLLIVTDDQGYGDLRSNGNTKIDTPHLDSIAETGLRLDRFHVCPNCAPTRASLLTARYHYRTGVTSVSRGEEVMRGSEVTMAEVFRANGYATGCFGKWHNGSNWPHNPNGQGFDEFLGICQGHWNNYFDVILEKNGQPEPTNGFVTDVLTDAAIDFMKRSQNADSPFFCYVPYNTPHSPYQAPEALFTKYREREFDEKTAAVYAMVESIDGNVGRMLAWLAESGLEERTIVIFMSDNGPVRAKKGEQPRFNGHLYGAKGSVHEGGVRVPCFVKFPGVIPAKSNFGRITAHIDWLPTLVDLCKLEWEERPKVIDGRSLGQALRLGKTPDRWPNRILFTSHTPENYDTKNAAVSVRTDRWVALRDPKWQRGKTDPMQSGWELYDLQADPFQQYDVAVDYPFLVGELRADFAYWMDITTGDGLGRIPTEIGHPEWPVVTLRAQDAILSDPENWEMKRGNNSWIANWTSTDLSIRWPVKIETEGRYSVEIDYCLKTGQAPTRLKLTAGEETLEFQIEESFDPEPIDGPDLASRSQLPGKNWKRIKIGEVELNSEIETVIVQPLELRSESIELKNLVVSRSTKQNPNKP